MAATTSSLETLDFTPAGGSSLRPSSSDTSMPPLALQTRSKFSNFVGLTCKHNRVFCQQNDLVFVSKHTKTYTYIHTSTHPHTHILTYTHTYIHTALLSAILRTKTTLDFGFWIFQVFPPGVFPSPFVLYSLQPNNEMHCSTAVCTWSIVLHYILRIYSIYIYFELYIISIGRHVDLSGTFSVRTSNNPSGPARTLGGPNLRLRGGVRPTREKLLRASN